MSPPCPGHTPEAWLTIQGWATAHSWQKPWFVSPVSEGGGLYLLIPTVPWPQEEGVTRSGRVLA